MPLKIKTKSQKQKSKTWENKIVYEITNRIQSVVGQALGRLYYDLIWGFFKSKVLSSHVVKVM